ncbi:hypothetical protein [Azospirillum argentinense]
MADPTLDKLILQEAARGPSEPHRRRACVAPVQQSLGVSERRACRVLGPNCGSGR